MRGSSIGALFSSFVEEDRQAHEAALASPQSEPQPEPEPDPGGNKLRASYVAPYRGGSRSSKRLMPWQVQNLKESINRSLPPPEQRGSTVYCEGYKAPPKGEPALIAYARYLGFEDPNGEDRKLLWIAQNALTTELPPGWQQVEDSTQAGESYYYNEAEGTSSWEHPMDRHYRSMCAASPARTVAPSYTQADVWLHDWVIWGACRYTQLKKQQHVEEVALVDTSLRPTWGGVPVALHDHAAAGEASVQQWKQMKATRRRERQQWAREQ
jgi:hypothetical protein